MVGLELMGCDFGGSQSAMQQRLQQAVQDQKQKGEAEQRAAVSQLDLELRQARQQLVDARREASDAKLEVDALRT